MEDSGGLSSVGPPESSNEERRGPSQSHGWLCACHMHHWPAWAKQHAGLQKPSAHTAAVNLGPRLCWLLLTLAHTTRRVPGTPPAAAAAAVCCLLPQSAAHLNIAHTKLANLAGLSGLQVINGDLIAWDNQNLVNMQGLGPITQLYGKLWMDSNPMLQDMTGLEVG